MRPSKDHIIREALASGVYTVTSDGGIISTAKGKPVRLKQSVSADGYARVGLTVAGKAHYVKWHRVVAIALILNPDNKPTVNHIDGESVFDEMDANFTFGEPEEKS